MSEYNGNLAFNAGLARETSIEAATVFNELSFWAPKTKGGDGWVYKSYAEMMEKVPLSEYQLRKAYKLLDEKGIIEVSIKKVEGAPTLHFRILKNFRMETEKTSETMETEKTSETIYIDTDNKTDNTTGKDFRDGDSLTNKEMDELLFFSLVDELGFDKTRIRLSTERRKKLAARLKSFTQDEMISAARAIRANEYMQGKNDGRVRYGTIDYLLRNDEKVEQWLVQAPQGERFGYHNGKKIFTEDDEGNQYWGGELITPQNQDKVLKERNEQ